MTDIQHLIQLAQTAGQEGYLSPSVADRLEERSLVMHLWEGEVKGRSVVEVKVTHYGTQIAEQARWMHKRKVSYRDMGI